MQPLYTTTTPLDRRTISKYLLNEELLMENAANALKELIQKLTHRQSVIYIVCGSGDNGADGYALGRKLQGDYRVRIYEAREPKSPLCRLQAQRASVAGVEWSKKILPCDVLVDCLFGSGFSGELAPESSKLIMQMNTAARINIACDIPSGLDLQGRVGAVAFRADYTMSMGALKAGLFSDSAKDVVGEVLVGDLGVSRALFEVQSPFSLLELSDLRLPDRSKHNCHKGSFGHVVVVAGEKTGAALLCAKAALRIGAGLVSAMDRQGLGLGGDSGGALDSRALDSGGSRGSLDSGGYGDSRMPESSGQNHALIDASIEIMRAHTIPANTSVLCMGMGLGRAPTQSKRANTAKPAESTASATRESALSAPDSTPTLLDSAAVPLDSPAGGLDSAPASPLSLLAARLDSGELGGFVVLDADVFYDRAIVGLVERHGARLVLTPHPKEFASLLELCEISAPTSLPEIVEQRFALALAFSQSYPDATLLLKGANPIIAHDGRLYINPLGTPALAKGGSGDVLAGLIAGFLAQGHSPLDSATNATLAHALAAKKEQNAFALTPLRLIEHIGAL